MQANRLNYNFMEQFWFKCSWMSVLRPIKPNELATANQIDWFGYNQSNSDHHVIMYAQVCLKAKRYNGFFHSPLVYLFVAGIEHQARKQLKASLLLQTCLLDNSTVFLKSLAIQ